jgi:hypothetical protein
MVGILAEEREKRWELWIHFVLEYSSCSMQKHMGDRR